MPNLYRSSSLTLRAFIMASLLPAALFAGPAAAAAATAPSAAPLAAPEGTDAQVRAYWTPERLRSATPLDLHVFGPMKRGHAAAQSRAARQIVPGHAPAEAYDPAMATTLYDDAMAAPHAQMPQARQPLGGTGNIPYTTNRLYPQSDTALYKVYPYATIGQLYFTEPSGNYVCSASVIRRNVIATAGHCVHNGSTGYYTNWLFVPAENGSLAPFGSWTWVNANVSSAWRNGGGAVPNDQDDALIVLNQQQVNGRGKLKSLGDVTGWLGYEFNAPLPTAITQIGYPCNLDGCVDPVATYSAATAGPNNNFQWGTYSFGGASGGPELQDFGQAPSGLPSEPFGGNILVASTSYTYSATTEVDGGSILYAPGQNGEYTFGDLINWACGSYSTAC